MFVRALKENKNPVTSVSSKQNVLGMRFCAPAGVAVDTEFTSDYA